MNDESCCVVSYENTLDQNYWDAQYKANATGWDLGLVSPPIKAYIDTLKDKNIAILIPGCGNNYEAAYLLEQGFTNVTVIDIAPTLVKIIEQKFSTNTCIKVLLGDFFSHKGEYDLIIEQTFFCALPPVMRQKYVWKMHELLAKSGTLSGLFFNRTFEASPPFGGSQEEYEMLFKNAFDFIKLENSTNLYRFEGITCSGCMNTVTEKFAAINEVLNVSMNGNFTEILIVSTTEIPLEELQKIVSCDDNYKIKKITQ